MKSVSKDNGSVNRFLIWGVVFTLSLSIFHFVWSGFRKGDKIVYVDVIKLMNNYKGMEDAKKELTGKMAVWQSNLDTLRKEAEVPIMEYEKTKGKASARELQLMESLIESKQQQYVSYEQNIKDQFQKQDQELSQKILDKVNDFIKRYGKSKGYDFIMAATQYGNIVYAEEHVDITDDVLAGLNAEYSGK